MFDVRFLKNPFFVPDLSARPGTDPLVVDYVLGSPDVGRYLELVSELLEFTVPRFESEGRSYLTIAVGCTGGRHRSVVVAEKLGAALSERLGLFVDVVHRDLDRVNMTGPGADPDHADGPRRGVIGS